MQDALDPLLATASMYRPERSMLNATMLLTHAAAALAGHTGPARRDDRARELVHALCDGPAWVKKPSSGSQGHKPGWQDGIDGGGGIQHLVVDTEIAWALMRRVARARGARPRPRPRPDRRPDRLAPRRRVLAVAGAAPEPDQLVRADVRRRRDRRRRPRRPARAAAQAAAPLRRRRAQADERRDDLQPRRRLPLPLPAAGGPSTTSTTSTAPSTRTSSAACWSPTSRRATPGCRRWTRAAPRSCARGASACCAATGRTPAT